MSKEIKLALEELREYVNMLLNDGDFTKAYIDREKAVGIEKIKAAYREGLNVRRQMINDFMEKLIKKHTPGEVTDSQLMRFTNKIKAMNDEEIRDYFLKNPDAMHEDTFNALAAELRGRGLDREYEIVKAKKDVYTKPWTTTKEYETFNKVLTELDMYEAALNENRLYLESENGGLEAVDLD